MLPLDYIIIVIRLSVSERVHRPTITGAYYNMLLISHDLDRVGENVLKRAD